MERPQDIGIKAIELYFPSQCVDQAELEKFDGVATGKYTIGLGQTKMSFCDDREDIYSIALTTLSSLLRKYSIDPKSIGRLEVGTETMLDKSKSVKSVLMQLFKASGNFNVEGVDTVNACYGGTNALFNTVNWIESSAWDGRDAIVVAGDIALYAQGAARPTGGVGCVAMLVGPNAPIVLEPGLRVSYMTHAYDFYKPDLTSEYPVVDGHFSLRCYTEALDACYKAYNAREAARSSPSTNGVNGTNGTNGTNGYINGVHNGSVNGTNSINVPATIPEGNAVGTSGGSILNLSQTSKGIDEFTGAGTLSRSSSANTVPSLTPFAEQPEAPLDRFDHICFHAPTCKTVAKSYARLLYNDYLAQPTLPLFADVPAKLQDIDYTAGLTDKEVEKTFMSLSKKRFAARVQPAIEAPTMCGNMYCASVYGSLCSLLANVGAERLLGTRVGIFSYGSGLASSFFSLRIKGDVSPMTQKLDFHARLAARRTVPPQVYDEMCHLREKAHLQKNYTPSGSADTLFPQTYYLTAIDDMFRRSYAIKE